MSSPFFPGIDPDGASMEGWLVKRCAAFESVKDRRLEHPCWMRRYCILKGQTLTYFTDNTLEKKIGRVALTEAAHALPFRQAKMPADARYFHIQRPFGFVLHVGSSLLAPFFYFDAESQEALTAWIQKIHAEVGSSGPPPCAILKQEDADKKAASYCSLHNSANKRLKLPAPAMRSCLGCRASVTTDWEEFTFCGTCALRRKRCMVCGEDANAEEDSEDDEDIPDSAKLQTLEERSPAVHKLFEALDKSDSGRLSSEDIRRLATILGFDSDEDTWDWKALSTQLKWESETGCDALEFLRAVEDESCLLHLEPEEVPKVSAVLEQTPQEITKQACIRNTEKDVHRCWSAQRQKEALASKSKDELLTKVLEWLDVDKNGHVSAEEAYWLARYLGYPDSIEGFSKFFIDICEKNKFDPKAGPTTAQMKDVLCADGGIFEVSEAESRHLLLEVWIVQTTKVYDFPKSEGVRWDSRLKALK
mmetsp:Transcript_1778/g.3992  ORF Transcript_1778/g.3992 Transcript_1778/m.3992 type:complete len:476 (+) Transcript_1778:218-1645(+)